MFKSDQRSTYVEYFGVFVVTILTIGIISYHIWSINHIWPIFDGNSCVARISNLGLLLSRGSLSEYFRRILLEKNNFLSMSYFSLFSAFCGPGRVAWGFAWALAVVAFLISQVMLLHKQFRPNRILSSFLLTAACSTLFAHFGGLLDNRFDLFSVLFVLAAVGCVISHRLPLALMLSILAIYAKGPALPVVAILWLSGIIAGVISLQELRKCIGRKKLLLCSCVALVCIYKIHFLDTVVSYNLSAVSGQSRDLSSTLSYFLISSIRTIFVSKSFYAKSLFYRSPFSVVFIFSSFFYVVLEWFRKRKETNNAIFIWGLSYYFLVYILFSAHPVKALVLDIWFLPAFWILALATLKHLEKLSTFRSNLFRLAIPFLAIFQFLLCVFSIINNKTSHTNQFQSSWQAILKQSRSLGEVIISKSNLTNRTVRLLPNFLYVPNDSQAFAYDSYRVLLFEAMGKNSPYLEGWELATRSDDWKLELKDLPSEDILLALIVTEGPDYIHFRKEANRLGHEFIAEVNPHCELKSISGTSMEGIGIFKFFLTDRQLSHCID